jgi:hypothetical protein
MGMAIIVVEPRDEAHVLISIRILCRVGINARRPMRPFTDGFIYVSPGQTKQAADFLAASGISANVRPE